jgi:pyruvate dehydrogenase E1 component alpha subunit
LFRSTLLEQDIATETTLDQIERQLQDAVAAAIDFAKSSPLPRPEDALTDVFAS